MSFALYIMSAAISMRRILYMISKKPSSSCLFVFTDVEGGSMRWVLYGLTCDISQNHQKTRVHRTDS